MFDPLGFLAPVLIKGKFMLRQMTTDSVGWDEELEEVYSDGWNQWFQSLDALEQLQIPRTYVDIPLSQAVKKEIVIFCDASEQAIAAVAYLRVLDKDGTIHVGFVMGKAKLAPTHGHSLPRLELCAAVLGVEIGGVIQDTLGITCSRYYTDSKVVLGYIYNNSRRFYTYVSNRVEQIRHTSKPDDWHHVPTDQNPADLGTRAVTAMELPNSMWLTGPAFLRSVNTSGTEDDATYELVEPDKELRPVTSCLTKVTVDNTLYGKFSKFSSLRSLVRAVTLLKNFVRKFKTRRHSVKDDETISTKDIKAKEFIFKTAQEQYYHQELECLREGRNLPKSSSVSSLNPFLDGDGILRVGGRLENADLSYEETHPIILPAKSHVSLLVVRMCHEEVQHQGRLITEGAVRSAGFWITGVKRLISSMVYQCVKCKKLRGRELHQVMAPLPPDRLITTPPFTNVGIDVFGPWQVITRKTRGGQANNKRWAVLFSCLTTRAVHIEVIEEMSTSSFLNALRRLVALRGEVKLLRSDRGTNFVGAEKIIGKDIKWIFNPPHASHMGGVWERMIGIARKILDSMFADNSTKGNLTHEVLVTLMAEVSAVMNSRPITNVSNDPEDPLVLSPALLLTHKNFDKTCHQEQTDIDLKDIYRSQWKRVQHLSNMFWLKWRKEYLQTLQARRKWTETLPNLAVGDVVLLKDKDTLRGQWPLGRISQTMPSEDGKVRKAMVTINRDGKKITLERPTSMVVPLDCKNVS